MHTSLYHVQPADRPCFFCFWYVLGKIFGFSCAPEEAAAALSARLRDAEADVAKAAWSAIQKRLEDSDPDVNRVWLEELRCTDLNPTVHAEAG